MSNYYTIKEDGEFQIMIKKSEFICYLRRIESEEEAKEWIQLIKKEHRKARHHCSAYVIGKNQAIQHFNDDGEPSGTAGIPMLEVLKIKQLENVLAVVVRYFGGIKLGTGGLIRAYGSSVSEAIEHIGIVEKKLQQTLHLISDYSVHGKIEYFIKSHPEYTLVDTLFTEQIEWIISVDVEQVTSFNESIIELLNNHNYLQFVLFSSFHFM